MVIRLSPMVWMVPFLDGKLGKRFAVGVYVLDAATEAGLAFSL
jgi:hypothetical protein